MEVHKAPFQEESRLSMGLCAQSHVSRWEGSSWAWGWGLREGGGGGTRVAAPRCLARCRSWVAATGGRILSRRVIRCVMESKDRAGSSRFGDSGEKRLKGREIGR